MNTATHHQKLEERFALLEEASRQLKREFVGIDTVIDQVLQIASSWFMFPEFQERPTIINLWGLTGVGKTALVKRLGELLEVGDRLDYVNLREANGSGRQVFDNIEALEKRHPGDPVVIVLDEFQAIRTKDERGQEKNDQTSGLIWPLLESGRLRVPYYNDYRYQSILEIRYELPYTLASGIIAKNGRVVVGHEQILKERGDPDFLPPRSGRRKMEVANKDIFLIPDRRLGEILFLAAGKFASKNEVREHLNKLDGPGTVEFLRRILADFACKGVTLDFSKSLIFVLGNVEKIYELAGDLDPDTDPDTAHRQSLQIRVPVLKEVLEQMFRSEQIARLGNNHIIYPTFNSDSFKKIIGLELQRIATKVQTQKGYLLVFSNSLLERIFSEGVYPSQGTRPVFSTINHLITGNIGRIFIEIARAGIEPCEIHMDAGPNGLLLECRMAGKLVHSFSLSQIWKLEAMRAGKRDDCQARVAVHEAGHAILIIFLLKIIPENIFSTSTMNDRNGMVRFVPQDLITSPSNLLAKLAADLGGFVAEELIFGEANKGMGSESDIEKATSFALYALKRCGYGKVPAAIHAEDIETRNYIHHPGENIDRTAETWLCAAKDLARKTLEKKKPLLLTMAGYLADNRSLNKQQIESMVFYSPFEPGTRLKPNSFPYRKTLKAAIAEDINSRINQTLDPGNEPSLREVFETIQDIPPDLADLLNSGGDQG